MRTEENQPRRLDLKRAPAPLISDTIVAHLKNGSNCAVLGPAGSGKSTLIESIVDSLSGNVAITATTGIAALNVGGSTIHSLAGIRTFKSKADLSFIKDSWTWEKTKSVIKATSYLIIDEISMLRRDTFELVDAVLRSARNCKKPFGGIPTLVCGDFLQLPPVVMDDEEIDGPWAFQSPLWADCGFQVVALERVYRQDDARYISALRDIRLGACSKSTNAMFRSRDGAEVESNFKPVVFLAKNAQVDEINGDELSKLPGKTVCFNAIVAGCDSIAKAKITRDCIAPEVLHLKRGAQVMILVNDHGRRFGNGTIGKIVGFEDGYPVVKTAKTNHRVTFRRNTWESKGPGNKILATFSQIPLKLSYACTIHKSQGLTLDFAEVDLAGIFAPGQAYVALSRVRSLDGLVLRNWSRDSIMADEAALKFVRNGHVWSENRNTAKLSKEISP